MTTDYPFELFLSIIKLFSTFVVCASFAAAWATTRFLAKTRDTAQGLIYQVYATSHWSRNYYVTTKISWLNRLPKLLSNGAPLKRYARRVRY